MAIAVRRTAWDPFNTLARQFDADFDNLVRHAFGRTAVTARPNTGFVPAADVTRDGADVVVTLELPGVDVANDVDVEAGDGRLVISGKRTRQRGENTDGVLVREIRAGAFRRQFALPDGVTGDQVTADYADGLLTVRVRDVVRKAPQPTKIKVRTGSADEIPAVDGATDAAGAGETE